MNFNQIAVSFPDIETKVGLLNENNYERPADDSDFNERFLVRRKLNLLAAATGKKQRPGPSPILMKLLGMLGSPVLPVFPSRAINVRRDCRLIRGIN